MEFNAYRYSYPSRRNVVFASRGMACSSSPVASNVGIEIMKRGGNAIDAAIAMAGVYPLVEPTSNGLGSDCFVLVWTNGKLYGLDGSGYSPKAMNADVIHSRGYQSVPFDGWLPVMVPGAVASWAELRRRFGTLPLEELLSPAIKYAEDGYPVPVTASQLWQKDVERFRKAFEKEPEVFRPFFDYFTKNGRAYSAGELFRIPDMARTLEELAATDCESFYRGEIARRIVEFSERTGGYLTFEDLSQYHPKWVEPITINYRGYDVYEMPPNGHGITALMALKILSGMDIGRNRECADVYHRTIEALKLAFVDAKKFVADPRFMKTKVEDMLSERYAATRRALITDTALMPEAGDPSCGGTVYFCTADNRGNMVSFIQSNYRGFGSGVVVPGTGISLQDRGANFSMDPGSDNYISGAKKSYHTIIPGFICKDGKPIGPFGVMGGFMQPQGHVQVVTNIVDFGMNPQEALDAPRWQWTGEKKIQLEREVPEHIAKELQLRGHQIEITNTNIGMGRGEIIFRMDNGVLAGGTEPRTDGTIAIW